MTKTLPIYALAVALLVVALVLLFKPFETTLGAGWIGFQSHIQSATTTTVGPDTVVTLFADEANAQCHSRVITTNYNGVLLSFGDVAGFGSTTLAIGAGHWQPASTTVAYDSGLYGCGLLSALGDNASSTITISSF